MSSTHDDLPLTQADLERVRADLQGSIRHTEELLQRTQTLILAVALLKYGVAIELVDVEGGIRRTPSTPTGPLDDAALSTN
jgi:hypothetical protein